MARPLEDNDICVLVAGFSPNNFMLWSNYRTKFRRAAEKIIIDSIKRKHYVATCLNYAKPLFDNNLPIVYDNQHLAKLLGYDPKLLYKISNNALYFYREFSIPKKSRGFRVIAEPLPTLKEIQRWILDNILNNIKISPYAKAFRVNYSIKSNAKFHINQNYVLSLDIKNYFPSIKTKMVYSLFLDLGYSCSISMMLTKLCTLNNSLPQGAPTSPAISNIIGIRFDKRIGGFAVKNKLRYTRYADDMTISGNSLNSGRIISFIRYVLEEEEFSLNENKTRLMMPHERQEVTGITVNRKINAPKKLRRLIRKELYYINKFGIESHMSRMNIIKRNYIPHLIGLINFVLFLRPNDKEMIKYKDSLYIFNKSSTGHY